LRQSFAVLWRVEPAILSRRVWEGDHHRTLAETLADSFLERARPQKTSDRHLADQDQDLRLQQSQLGVEPVRAVRHRGGGRPEVAGVLRVAAWEAAHQGGDVCEPSKFFRVAKAGAEHPAVELLARTP
jgi:hypothetical protein